MSLQAHCQLLLKKHGNWKTCLKTGGKHHSYYQKLQECLRNLRATQTFLSLWEDDETVNPGNISRHKDAGQGNHHLAWICQWKSFLTNLITFYDKTTVLVEEEGAVSIVCPDIVSPLALSSHKEAG